MYYHTEIYFPEQKIWKIHKHSLTYIEAVVQMCSVKKVFLEISQKFTGKHLRLSLYFNKVAAQQTFVLVKKYWRRLEDVLKTSSM